MMDIPALPPRAPAADDPILSIIVPACNVAPYIRATIESALDQTLQSLEVIVVDDGSKDTTRDILQTIRAERADPRLHIILQNNQGLSNARNVAMQTARGRYLGFLDGDDIWQPHKAETHVRIMDADPSLGATFSLSEYITEPGHKTGGVQTVRIPRPSLHDLIRRNHLGNGSTPVVRRTCFETAGLFRPDLRSCEDYEMWCRLVYRSGCHVQLIPEPLTLYRLRTSSLSFNFSKFLENADIAMTAMAAEMPAVPAQVFRTGHAEHYRIAAWKATSIGQSATGRKLLWHAIKLRPWIMLADWRALGTATALLFPPNLRTPLARLAKSIQQRRPMRAEA